MRELLKALEGLIKKVSGRQAFILLALLILMAGSYFISDRILDHLERVDEITKLKDRMSDAERILQNKVLTKVIEGE